MIHDPLKQHFFTMWQDQFATIFDSSRQPYNSAGFENFTKGVTAYSTHPYQRTLQPPEMIWQQGSTRLLDYQSGDITNPAILFIPSLINRSYILDLHEKSSFVRYLAAQHIHPYVLDFGEPVPEEYPFNCGDYITERVEPAIAHITRTTGRKISLGGYCMGGMMALSAAIRQPDNIASLALLATPWDFHQTNLSIIATQHCREALSHMIESVEKIPPQAIQSLFYFLNPSKFYQKFCDFAKIDQTSDLATHYVSVEHWVNDGISITSAVAKECLTEWLQYNKPLTGDWHVAGRKIDPAAIACPVMVIIPRHDDIVHPSSSQALADRIPHARLITPDSGHVGMVIGQFAEIEMWKPFAEWVKETAC